jgi:ABC-2 type transport system permease protein
LQLDRVLVVTRRVFVDLINDKRTLIVMFLTPIITMAIFGVAFGNYVADVPVIVVNKDEGYLRPSSNASDNISNKIIANLDTRVVKVNYSDNENEAIGRVKHGEAFAVIVFPEQFTRSVYTWTGNQSSSEGNTIKVIVDRSSVIVSDAVKNSVNDALLKTVEGAVKKTPINIDTGDTIYGQKIKPIDLSFPGVMTYVLFVMTTGLTIISLVEERTSGTLNRILASPLRESETVLGYTISYSFIAVAQAALFLTVGVMIFNVTIIGNVMLVFAVSALLAIVSQSLGILLSSTAKRLIHVSITAPFVFLVVLLLSGVYFPVQQIPSPLRPWSYVLPPTYAVDAMRSVILNGWGLDVIWHDILALCAFAVIFLTLATWSLKVRKGA